MPPMVDAGLKVFVTSYRDAEGTGVAAKLRQLWELSNRRHALVDDPDSADLILVGSVGNLKSDVQYLEEIATCSMIERYPEKCFSLSYRDDPLFLHHGVYESAARSLLGCGRVRSGAYVLSGSFNSHARAHRPSETDFEGKRYLLSFIGRRSHAVRDRIFALRFSRPDVLIEDSSTFSFCSGGDPAERERRERYFYEVMLRSKFSLCPRGSGRGSIRLFESLKLGVAPVVMSDGWVLPKGPRWEDFSIILEEGQMPALEGAVSARESSYREMGRLARQCYERYFADSTYFNYVVDSCVDIARGQRIPEEVYWALRSVIARSVGVKRGARRSLARITSGAASRVLPDPVKRPLKRWLRL